VQEKHDGIFYAKNMMLGDRQVNKSALGLLFATSALAAPVCAQSSVTLYGIVDEAGQFMNHVPTSGGKSGTSLSLISGGAQTSRWGLSVNEDLGGGYRTIVVLENGFDATNGTLKYGGRLFGRQSYIGVNSPYGTLTFGRQVTPVYDFDGAFDPVTSALYSSPMYDPAFVGRADNSAKYQGTLGVLAGQLLMDALYSFGYDSVTGAGPVAGAYQVGKEESLFVTYGRGIATIGLLFDQQNGNTVATKGVKTQRYGAGASVDLNPVQLYAGYRFYAQKQPVQNLHTSLYWLGLKYVATPYFNVRSDLLYEDDRNTGQGNPAALTVIASYLPSKRTDIYMQVGTVLNKKHSNLGLNGFGTTTTGAVQTGAMVGLRTHF
jgi:predicted porin